MICSAYCPTDDEPPQIRNGVEAWVGAVDGTGQGRAMPRSVVREWKTVTKLLGSITASSGLMPGGICGGLVAIIRRLEVHTLPKRYSGAVQNSW